MAQNVLIQGLFSLHFTVLKSSHGSANLSVLGNRSVKNETSPSVERQVCSITLLMSKIFCVHSGSTSVFIDKYFSDNSEEAEHRRSGGHNTEETSGQSK